MLRQFLIASAAIAMLLVTTFPDDAFARRGGGMHAGGFHGGGMHRGGAVAGRGYRGGAVAARGGRYDYRGYGYRGYGYRGYGVGVGAAAVGAAAVEQLRREPTTAAAAATTPTAAGFARIIERRDAPGLRCSKTMVKSSG